MDNEKGLQPYRGDKGVYVVPQSRRAAWPLRLRTRTQSTLFLTSLLGLFLWLHMHLKCQRNFLSTQSILEDEFVHWPLYIGSESDRYGTKKGPHQGRPPFLNGKPAEKLFL